MGGDIGGQPMTKRDDLIALAERVEALEGPCRETDADIYLAADAANGSFEKLYTASLDAAMTLAPEGWTYISVEICAHGKPGQHCRASVERLHDDEDQRCAGYAKEPALAITAAALRALAAMETTDA